MTKSNTIKLFNLDTHSVPITVCCNHDANCPRCGSIIPSNIKDGFYTESHKRTDHQLHIYLIKFCDRCHQISLLEYEVRRDASSTGFYILDTHFVRESPQLYFIHTSFSQTIKELSPRFVEIYNESEEAEQNSLLSICGMGYRKSFEFLVKDYLISLHPDEEVTIRKAPLGHAISHWIQDDKLKVLASRAVWIGNDETHYIQQHDECTIDEMKSFIKAFVSSIDFDAAFKIASQITKENGCR